MSALVASWSCAPYEFARADRIAAALGLSPTVAAILVRRGHASVEAARRFLAADELHEPWLLRDMEAACDSILGHVRRGSRIVVHGDYDVDGVSSTAIVVQALRSLGADPHWHLPSRLEGYGLSTATVEQLGASGCGLLVTTDCGITSVAEVEAARAAGLDVVVTDHHRPGDRLPPCPVIHPGLDPYPFEGLCAAGVAHKLSTALRSRAGLDPAGADRDLDLVGLATVCDLVPLTGENRTLVRRGLAAVARTERPGLRALMHRVALEPGDVDERAVGFRLGPRLNAAGRLRRADAALELLLTDDERRAAEVADELDLLNRDRRDVETRMLFAAEAARTEQADAPAYVLAGEGWHPGVAGIVASRMTERHNRPCVVIALDGDSGRGSGRSIPAFDLHAALGACAGHLRRFGGHRAAAGLEIDRSRIDDFRADFVRHAASVLSPADLVPVRDVDAVVPGTALGLGLAEELRQLAPFGYGNREPVLLVPATRVGGVRAMGEEGQHSRFTLGSAGSRAEAVAFRVSPAALARDAPEGCDAVVRLELNEWNGRVEARVLLESLCAREPGRCVAVGEEPFWDEVDRELSADLALAPADPGRAAPAPVVLDAGNRTVRDRRAEGIAGVTGDLLSSGEPVLVVCADVARRRDALVRTLAPAGGELAVASWRALERVPALARPYAHLLCLDPPPTSAELDRVAARTGTGHCHLAWGPAEVDFTLRVTRAELDLGDTLADAYRRLRSAVTAGGPELEALLRGAGPYPRPGHVCGRVLRVLSELELVVLERDGAGAVSCRALAAPRTALERSPAHHSYKALLERAERDLAAEAARLREPRHRTAAAVELQAVAAGP